MKVNSIFVEQLMQKYGKISGDLNLHFSNMFEDHSIVLEISNLYHLDLKYFWQIVNQYKWTKSINNLLNSKDT